MDIVRSATRSAGTGLVVVIAAVLASCGSVSDGGTQPEVVEVYAASSLTDVYTELEQRFEAIHPEIDIRLNLAGSSTLARQINDGAPASIFAPADVATIDELDFGTPVTASHIPKPYATNQLVLVVPIANPQSVGSVSDLEQGDVLTARCISGVPCGDATNEVLVDTGINLAVATEETNVRSVLAKVAAGEVDAGFVYRTDAQTESDVEQVSIFELPIVQLVALDIATLELATDHDRSELSSAFVSFIYSEEAATVLDDAGFGRP